MTAIPPPPAPRLDTGPRTLEVTVPASMRDRDLSPDGGSIQVRLQYRPEDPYAIRLYFSQPPQPEEVLWVGSRDAFVAAGLHGVPLPGLDMTVQALTITLSQPGVPDRDVPTLRIGLFETTEDHSPAAYGQARHTGSAVYLDLELDGRLRGFLRRIVEVVPPGTEGRYLDIDTAIRWLLRGR